MLFKNAFVLLPDGTFKKNDVMVKDGKIVKVGSNITADDVVDADGKYLVPGFIDIHTHGCVGGDFCDADKNSISRMLKFLASKGVTSCLATTMSFDEKILTDILTVIKGVGNDDSRCALRGVYLEGPFISKSKKGAQNEKYIMPFDRSMFERLCKASGNSIKVIAVAPECENVMENIHFLSEVCTVSLAHTASDYETAVKAFEKGAAQVTHFYNAMPPFNHREPGLIGAAFEKAKRAELICDGIHVHESVIRTTFELMGEDRICLISDSIRACGMADGEYMLGGQNVIVKGREARLADNTIAGSATCLADCVRNAIAFGLKPEKAFISATKTPAISAGIYDVTGSIEVGKQADFQLLDKQYNLTDVYINGKKVLEN